MSLAYSIVCFCKPEPVANALPSHFSLRRSHYFVHPLFRPTRPADDLFDPLTAATGCLFPSRPVKGLNCHAHCFVLNCLPIWRPSMLSSSVRKQPIRGRPLGRTQWEWKQIGWTPPTSHRLTRSGFLGVAEGKKRRRRKRSREVKLIGARARLRPEVTRSLCDLWFSCSAIRPSSYFKKREQL